MTQKRRDVRLAEAARKNGAHYALMIIQEAKRAGIDASLGLAIIEQETGFSNEFGEDYSNVPFAHERVTKRRYLAFRKIIKDRGWPSNGVGVSQLTSTDLLDAADKLGGAWVPRWQCRVGFTYLAANIKRLGRTRGVAAYNGSGPAAFAYAIRVNVRARRWHRILRGV